MPKLRKLRRSQKFSYKKDRKRVRKSQEATKKNNVKVSCQTMRKNWDKTKAVQQNLSDFGLAFNPNTCQKVNTTRSLLVQKAKEIREEAKVDSPLHEAKDTKMIRLLQKEAEEDFAVQRAKSSFRFNQEQVKWITYLMDKHGDDFKAMSKDPKNHFQETPKQIRQKVLKFISIPEQFAPYAKQKGLLDAI